MKIRIESEGHCVEIEHSDTNRTPEQLAQLAEHVWGRTKAEPKSGMGYGSQLSSQTRDRPVAGDRWSQVQPVQA